MEVKENYSLKAYNTFGLDVMAGWFVEVKTEAELLAVLNQPEFKDKPLLVLGGGSNVLLTKNFDGRVLKISTKGIEKIKEDDRHVWIKVAAGEVWHEVVLYCIAHNYAGIENLSLIPGLMGAAPMQNIGAYGVELKQVFDHLEAIEIASGNKRTFSNSDCAFGYRESVFKKALKGKYIISAVTLKLSKIPDFNVSYGAINETLEEMGISELSIKAISDAVIAIRSSKLPDPKDLGNSGSFFKNPEIPKTQFEHLIITNPNMPHYPLADGNIKIPAGWLIEQCGWKGKRVGNTGSHAKQALVLVNYGNATGQEVKQLAFDIKASVKEQFGIDIIPEVNII